MPTYEYACPDCEHLFESFQSITAKPIKKCPECGKRKVQRLISGGAGLLFKGSGFYITDYRSDNYKNAAKKDSDSSSGSKTESKKSDSKKSDTKKSDTKKSSKKDAA
ncbi:MAG: zinc ribbon domain-containing protein [Candidatus Latescibacteria bacterium]|jgi:putative FmdB family regulatory protein|nr:zinc ribbon domain-containing protein [Candidatus Latescibacterota bacterium]MBT5832582.1 zinc ribbon domain-containing protein [Candidatus Latescibacterota bacterium]